jgi:hypothetical protein
VGLGLARKEVDEERREGKLKDERSAVGSVFVSGC